MRLFVLTLSIVFTSLAFAENHDHHDHAQHGQHRHSQDDLDIKVEKKFTPDEDLRKRMDKFPSLMRQLEGQKTNKRAMAKSGKRIADLVQDILANCKLEPEADAAIHPVLAVILQGTEELKNGNFEEGHSMIHKGLQDYGRLFDHKGWSI